MFCRVSSAAITCVQFGCRHRPRFKHIYCPVLANAVEHISCRVRGLKATAKFIPPLRVEAATSIRTVKTEQYELPGGSPGFLPNVRVPIPKLIR